MGKKIKKFYSVSPRGSATESFVQNEAARSQTLLAATNRCNQSSFYAATWKSFVFLPPFLLNSLQVFISIPSGFGLHEKITCVCKTAKNKKAIYLVLLCYFCVPVFVL